RGAVADRHRRHVGLVADAIAEGRLIEPAVHGLLVGHRLAGRYGDDVTAVLAEATREVHGVVGVEPAVGPVARRDLHRHRLRRWPDGAHGVEDFEGIAGAGLQPAAVLVAPAVRQRAPE